MQLSPLQLEDSFFRRLNISWVDFPPQEGETISLKCQTSFDYEVSVHRDEPTRWKMELRASFLHSLNGNAAGLQIETEVVGLFRSDGPFPETLKESKELLLRINGFGILSGILRGVIASSTGVFPGGKFITPTFSPASCVRAIETKRSQLVGLEAQSKGGDLPLTGAPVVPVPKSS